MLVTKFKEKHKKTIIISVINHCLNHVLYRYLTENKNKLSKFYESKIYESKTKGKYFNTRYGRVYLDHDILHALYYDLLVKE
jgi:hypothetical protein